MRTYASVVASKSITKTTHVTPQKTQAICCSKCNNAIVLPPGGFEWEQLFKTFICGGCSSTGAIEMLDFIYS